MDYGEKIQFDDSKDNLNLENWSPNRDVRSIGNRAITSEGVTLANEQPDTPEIGMIFSEPETAPQEDPLPQPLSFNADSTHGNGHEISKDTLSTLKDLEGKLAQTENISNFYNEIRTYAMEYQSKIGEEAA